MTVDDPANVLVYGPAGHGKTYLIGTAVGDKRLMPMLLAEFEAGTRTIRSKCRRVTVDDLGKPPAPTVDKIDLLRVTTWHELEQLLDFLDTAKNPYQSVALDSLSEIGYLNLTTVVNEQKAKNSSHDKDVPEIADYLRHQIQLRRLVRDLRDLPIHTIFTAGVVEVEDARTRKPALRPSFSGKLVNEMPGLIDVVGYLAVVEEGDGEKAVTYRSLMLQPGDRFYAKLRREGDPISRLDRPTLPKLLDLVEGKMPEGAVR